MSVFSVQESTCIPCVFAPTPGLGTEQLVSFVRLNSVRNGYAPVQNSAGELVLSYVPIGPFMADIQPKQMSFPRYMEGNVVQIDYLGIVPNNVDIRVGDRCYLSSLQLEVVASMHYGREHTELELRQIGR
jgi:hypothetical protein